MNITNMTHNELAHNLATHLVREDRMVWEDIPAGRSGSVRPDVYTIQKSFQNPNPISYEIKVSKSDFRSDVTKAKWKSYLDFSYGVIFAVPKGLVTKNDLPEGCGLITFNGEFWNTVKKPTLHPKALDDELLLKLLIEGSKRESKKDPFKYREFNEYSHNEALRRKFGEDFSEKISFLDEYPDKFKTLTELKKELGTILNLDIDRWGFESNVKYEIDKLKVLANETERKLAIASELEYLRRSLDSNLGRIIKSYTNDDKRSNQ